MQQHAFVQVIAVTEQKSRWKVTYISKEVTNLNYSIGIKHH